MKKIVFAILCGLLPLGFISAQDLIGFQKLRGEVLSSDKEADALAEAFKAFDTNKVTSYKSKTEGGWIGLDLKEAYPVRKVRVFPRLDRPERMVGCVIQGADNPEFTNAVTLVSITVKPEIDQFTVYDVSVVEGFRYVRCLANDGFCNMTELEFYTDTDAQPIAYTQLTNLPTIYLETGGCFDFILKKDYAQGQVIVVDGEDTQINNAGIRGRGNSTWTLEKKAFRIKFDEKQQFMGLPAKAKSWTLIASHVDKTFLRNGLTFEMSRFLDFEFTPACVFVDVVLDGFYYGTYFVSDHIEVNKKRINVDEMEPEEVELPNVSGGYHLEIDGYARQEPVYITTAKGVDITIKSPKDDEIVPAQKAWIEQHINKLEETLYEDPELACEKYIDIESAVKYYLLSELTGNCDAYWCVHCYKKRGDDRLYFGPVWDYDQAYLNDGRVARYAPTLDVNFGFKQWFPRIMQTEAARKVLKRLWDKVIDERLKDDLLGYIHQNAALLQESQKLNYTRWNSLDKYIFTNIVVYQTYEEYIQYLKTFVNDRFDWYGEYVKTITMDKKHFLPASKPENEKQEWKYTLQSPQDQGWFTESFNDNGWQTGKAPFGTLDGYTTRWTTSEIYIRKTFEVEASDLAGMEKLFLSLFHDEDCWVYINGKLAKQCKDYITSYQVFEINNNVLKAGLNTIAIKCTQTVGGQMIDAGIFATISEASVANQQLVQPQGKISYQLNGRRLSVTDLPKGTIVSIYTVDGKQVSCQTTNDSEMQVILPGAGVYLIHAGRATAKIIVI